MIRFFFLNIGLYYDYIVIIIVIITLDMTNVNMIFVIVFWLPNKLISRSYLVTFNEIQAELKSLILIFI